jgi:hypothetical protein
MKSLLDMSVKSLAKSLAVFWQFFQPKSLLHPRTDLEHPPASRTGKKFCTEQIEDPIGFYASAWPNTNPQEVCTLQYDPLKAYEHTTIVFLLTLNF